MKLTEQEREEIIEGIVEGYFKDLGTRLRHPLKASRHGQTYDETHGKSRIYAIPTPLGLFGHVGMRGWKGPGERPGARIVTSSGRAYERKRKSYVTKAIKKEVAAKKAGKKFEPWKYHKGLDEVVGAIMKAPLRLVGHQAASTVNKAKHRMNVATGKAPMGSNWK